MDQERGDFHAMGFDYEPHTQPYGDGWLHKPPLADYRKLCPIDEFAHLELNTDRPFPEKIASRETDLRMNDLSTSRARADRKTGLRLFQSVSRRKACSEENGLGYGRGIRSSSVGLQPAALFESSSWYQQQTLLKKFGTKEHLAHSSLSGSGGLYFPDSSYECVSDCIAESKESKMVLCHRVKLNERQFSAKPCVAVSLPGTAKLMKKSEASPPPFRYPVSENLYSSPGCLPKASHANDDLDTLAPPRRARCIKISAATKARRQRLSRAIGKIVKSKQVDAQLGKPLEDDSTFAQVSPWGTFSCDTHDGLSENGCFSTGANKQGAKVVRNDPSPSQKRKPPTLVKKQDAKSKIPRSSQTDASRINMAVQSTLSAIRLHTESIGKCEERCRRRTESKAQRLKNIACCRALPAPPCAASSERRLPRITPPETTEKQSPTTRSQSSADQELTTLSQCDEETKGRLTTLIEAVRIVERARERRRNSGVKPDPPWPVPSLNESLDPRRVSVSLPKSCEPTRPSRPASGSNVANNASHEAKPARYVELLRRFRENLTHTRGKGIGARTRAQAAHAGKQTAALRSIVRTLQRAQKQRVLSCITHDRELTVFKTPTASPVKKSPKTPKSRQSSSSSKTKSRQQTHTKRKDANIGRRGKQTLRKKR